MKEKIITEKGLYYNDSDIQYAALLAILPYN